MTVTDAEVEAAGREAHVCGVINWDHEDMRRILSAAAAVRPVPHMPVGEIKRLGQIVAELKIAGERMEIQAGVMKDWSSRFYAFRDALAEATAAVRPDGAGEMRERAAMTAERASSDSRTYEWDAACKCIADAIRALPIEGREPVTEEMVARTLCATDGYPCRCEDFGASDCQARMREARAVMALWRRG